MISKTRVFFESYSLHIAIISGLITIISLVYETYQIGLGWYRIYTPLLNLLALYSSIFMLIIIVIRLTLHFYPGVDFDRIATEAHIKILPGNGKLATYKSKKIIKVKSKYRNSIPLKGLIGDGETNLTGFTVHEARKESGEYVPGNLIESKLHEISREKEKYELQFDKPLDKGKKYIITTNYEMKDSWLRGREYFRLKLNRHKHKWAKIIIETSDDRRFKTDSISLERRNNKHNDPEFSRALCQNRLLIKQENILTWEIRRPKHSHTYSIVWAWR